MKSKFLLMISILTAFSSVAGAQTDSDYAVPRTQWGQPDFQGVWNFFPLTCLCKDLSVTVHSNF